MKKYFLYLLIIIGFSACNDCTQAELNSCDENYQPNSENCGKTIVTCYANPGLPIGDIIDTRNNSTAPIGDDWGPTVGKFTPANWYPNQIGQIFGIAIDRDENIYLGSSDIYHYTAGFITIPSSNILRPNSAGRIFKCEPPSYIATPLLDLPNANDPLNGIGNIAYDKYNNQLFATNLEDGKIYRIATDGTILGVPFDPWTPDSGIIGIETLSERVWGIGVNAESSGIKIYFPRYNGGVSQLYSITLNDDGSFPTPGSEIIEINNLGLKQEIISDIAFSSDNQEMLITERGDPHDSQVKSYSLSGTWTFNRKYFVGGLSTLGSEDHGNNSAGGVDFFYTENNGNPSDACDEAFWVSGNYMSAISSPLKEIYGLQGIRYSGNNASTDIFDPNRSTDLFIDFDGLTGTGPKGHPGDVEVIDCTECVDPCFLNDYIK